MGAYRQSFAWWSFDAGIQSARSLLRSAAEIGYRGVDFLPPEYWPDAKEAGLELVIIDGHVPLEIGFNDRSRHAALADQVRRALDTAVAAKVRALAVASGNRVAGSEVDGRLACVEALAPLAAEADAAGVVLLLEPLNSKVDHPGHECDRTEWALNVVREVNSPGLRVLYDFYHAQIMEGDLLRTVEENLAFIGHFHTAGVPGRRDLDDRQEINWRAIVPWLKASAYAGYVAHEFIPRGDTLEALRGAFAVFADGAAQGR